MGARRKNCSNGSCGKRGKSSGPKNFERGNEFKSKEKRDRK